MHGDCSVPAPCHPDGQEHVKLPIVLLQMATIGDEAQGKGASKHSLISAHNTPLPENPVLQLHVKLPSVLMQSAFVAQLEIPNAHSSTS
jgi:hypothetical protein